MDIPSGIAAQAALTKQNVALSAIKQNADQGKAVAEIIDKSSQQIAASSSGRGGTIDILV